MSTNASISIQHEDVTIATIYLHWDGYPEHAGNMLIEHYGSYDKAKALQDLGDLSVLAETPEKCVAYHRDRGEEFSRYTHKSFKDYKCRGEEWNYLREYNPSVKDGWCWFVSKGSSNRYEPLRKTSHKKSA